MSVGEEVVAALEDFTSQLRRGERIMVTTVERCGCDKEGGCQMCKGGFVFSSKTLFPETNGRRHDGR